MQNISDKENLKTVVLDRDKCIGCITCMRRCPTQAIRIINGKASIEYQKCINCGECIRSCQQRAKRPVYDSLEIIYNYKYKIALPSPSLFAQFNNLTNINYVIEGLYNLGFDKVFEVSYAAELVTDCTKKMIDKGLLKKPVISSACPSVVELVLLKYHELKDNLMPTASPAKIAAKLAFAEAIKEGVPEEDIGVFFISPCPAKVYALNNCGKEYVSGVLSQSEIYFKLLPEMAKITTPKKLSKCGNFGLCWGSSGGESNSLGLGNYIHVDGVRNVITVLQKIEDGNLDGIDFVEINICPAGCVGGVFNVENPFVARSRLRQLGATLPSSHAKMEDLNLDFEFFDLQKKREPLKAFQFDENTFKAMEKMLKVEEILKTLPGTDCGECGSPTCRCHAEDIVMGREYIDCLKK